jgi:uncharacterized membrane protein
MTKAFCRNNLISLLVLAVTATFCTLPLILHSSLPRSQDMVYHIFQADQFCRNLSHGVFYPRWAGEAFNGYGSPNFIFYSPLSYYFVALIHLFDTSLISSMVAAIWFSFLFSGTMMFLQLNNFFPGYRGLIPAVLYQILPFHLYELYLRGSFAALFAYIWFPLILLLLYKIHGVRNPLFYLISLSFAYAALIMTHLASAFMFSLIVCVILLGFLMFRQFRTFMKSACAFGCGLALSSIYFIPAFLERRYVHMDYLINGPWGRYIDNFLFTKEKLHQDISQFSHFYTLLHLGVFADLVLFGFILFIANKRGVNPHKSLFIIFTSLFVLSFFLTIPLSKPLAYLLPGLSTLQFPWRWITFMELALAFLSGYLFSVSESAGMTADKMRNGAFFVIYIILSVVIIGTTGMFPGETIKQFENSAQFGYKMTMGVENIPSWAHNWLDIFEGLPPEPVSFIAGKGTYNVKLWEPQKRVVMFRSSVPSRVRISTFYYPGWKAELDGEKSWIAVENKTGAMLVNVPQGDHILKLIFGDTPLRVFSRYVSYGFCAVMALFALFSFKHSLLRLKKDYNS